jgi:hypothetical protein
VSDYANLEKVQHRVSIGQHDVMEIRLHDRTGKDRAQRSVEGALSSIDPLSGYFTSEQALEEYLPFIASSLFLPGQAEAHPKQGRFEKRVDGVHPGPTKRIK